jgi:hypothetical protein
MTTTGGTDGASLEYVNINGHDVYVKPKQLVQKHESKSKVNGPVKKEGEGDGDS